MIYFELLRDTWVVISLQQENFPLTLRHGIHQNTMSTVSAQVPDCLLLARCRGIEETWNNNGSNLRGKLSNTRFFKVRTLS